MSGEVPDAVTVAELLAQYEESGVVMSFAVESEGKVKCGSCNTASRAEDMAVEALARAEGSSDPDDMAMVAVVSCPWCRVAGTLVVGYGPTASAEDAEVALALQDERQKGEQTVLPAQ